MSIDRQGKDVGETSPNKSTQRGDEDNPGPVTQRVNRTKDKVTKVLKK